MRVCEFGTGSEPALTDKGKRQAAMMAAFLKRQIGRTDIVISGTEAAAIETGEVMAEALGSYVATTTLLSTQDTRGAKEEIARLAQQSADVLVVCLDDFLMSDAADLAPGAIALLVGPYIQWLVTPALIESTEELIEAAQELSFFMEKESKRAPYESTVEKFSAEVTRIIKRRWKRQKGKAIAAIDLHAGQLKEAKTLTAVQLARLAALAALEEDEDEDEDELDKVVTKAKAAGFLFVAGALNVSVLAAVAKYNDLSGIDSTTRDRLETAIEAAIVAGKDPGAAAAAVLDDATRAETIGYQAATAAFHEGIVEGGKSAPGAMKRWMTDSDPCQICEDNAANGWIDMDQDFQSGDDGPEAHPNCKCWLDMKGE